MAKVSAPELGLKPADDGVVKCTLKLKAAAASPVCPIMTIKVSLFAHVVLPVWTEFF